MTDNIQVPELILTNGKVYTLDGGKPVARAVAVGAGLVLAVGEDREITDAAGPGTTVVDLQGRAVMPGMMDSHLHFYDWAIGKQQLDLSGARSFEELCGPIEAEAATRPPGAWIVGFGWNESDWPVRRKPARDDLDAAAPANPTAVWRCDLHLVSVNSPALRAAGIDASTPDPPEGAIEKEASGRPTGILRELAANLIKTVIPAPDGETLNEIMRRGVARLNSLGLTSVHDMRLMGGAGGAGRPRVVAGAAGAGGIESQMLGEYSRRAHGRGRHTGTQDRVRR